ETEFCSDINETQLSSSGTAEVFHWIFNESEKLANDSSHTISSANESGTYRLVLENEYGCISDTSETKTLTIYQSPQMETINPSSASLCNGESIPLYIPLRSGVSYKWYRNNILQAGANNNTLTIHKEGDYTVEISNEICSVISDPSAITVLSIPKPELNYTGVVETCPSGEITLELVDKLSGYQYKWSDGNTAVTNFQYSEPFENIKYWITRSKSGCESTSDTVKIETKSDLKEVFLTPFGPTICYVGCSNKNISQYRWYIDGELIDDETDKVLMIGKLQDSENIHVKLEVTDNLGCSASTEIEINENTDFKTAGNILPTLETRIYPNPNTGSFNLDLEGGYFGEVIIVIYDATGKEVFRERFEKTDYLRSNEYSLVLTSGLYAVQINAGTNIWTEHLIVD
ncbi:MAG: T9SS type A sorting domain-containing protein, partial [Bacteroidales bacterium]|nr:T9SS type A sorting domain-containing protein [Bacteroidales bacterium]